MRKWNNFLLVTLMIMSSCKTIVNDLRVEKILSLDNFPSGSSLEYYDNKLYLSGDDAAKLLVLDTNYNTIDSLTLFESTTRRISKAVKADLESSAIVTINAQPHLLLVGSASLPTREKIVLLRLDTLEMQPHSISDFIKRLIKSGLKNVNIEGAASTGKLLVLANRGNLSNPYNHLVFTQPNFWLHQQSAPVNTAILILPGNNQFSGISGLTYIEKDDLLVFTASTETTENSFEDGEIGDSYIGWVKNISGKMEAKKILADGFINLSATNKNFFGEKIESLCISHSDNTTHTIHLVSDNDNGVSKLFKIRITIE